jgi:hypothetical protein
MTHENNTGSNKLKYVSSEKSPIIFTAPHCVNCTRHLNVEMTKFEIHAVEYNTRLITNRLTEHLNASCILWNEEQKNTLPHDPNYTFIENLEQSVWYQQMNIHFNSQYRYSDSFNFDIHGMKNAIDGADIHIGVQPLINFKHLFPDLQLDLLLKNVSSILSNGTGKNAIISRRYTAAAKSGVYTITQQWCSLGLPGIQIELSKQFRKEVAENEELLIKFANSLKKVHEIAFNRT